ncbi:MAG: hypothetical protein R2828_10530 [Saprospiraceae bacterium]
MAGVWHDGVGGEAPEERGQLAREGIELAGRHLGRGVSWQEFGLMELAGRHLREGSVGEEAPREGGVSWQGGT